MLDGQNNKIYSSCWNRIEIRETKAHIYIEYNIWTGIVRQISGEMRWCLSKGAGKMVTHSGRKKVKLDHYLTPYQK